MTTADQALINFTQLPSLADNSSFFLNSEIYMGTSGTCIKMAKESSYLDFQCLQDIGVQLVQDTVVRAAIACLFIPIVIKFIVNPICKNIVVNSEVPEWQRIYAQHVLDLREWIWQYSFYLLCFWIIALRYVTPYTSGWW